MAVITDEIYGSFEVHENIGKLLSLKSMQRLKKIHQSGAAFLVDPDLNHSRYEHSIGAMLLAKIFGGSEDAQIAALLHDISHTAFSHTSDLVVDFNEKSYHELIRKKYLSKTDVSNNLSNMGLDANYILNTKNFPILNAEMPDLCVDRLDYLFRDMHAKRMMKKDEIKKVISDIVLDKGVLKCNSINTAKFLLDKFIILNQKIFFDGGGEAANALLSYVIRRIIDEKAISYEDLLQDDDSIIEKIKNTKYSYIFSIMKPNIGYKAHFKPELNNMFLVKRKLRYIDPIVIGAEDGSKDKRITEIDIDSKTKLDKYLKTEKTVYYKITGAERSSKCGLQKGQHFGI